MQYPVPGPNMEEKAKTAGVLHEYEMRGDPAVAPMQPARLTLPEDSSARKEVPLYAGLLRYFPAALAGVARHSKIGNDKHNPGEELHHAREKSTDQEDCIMRHLMDIGDMLAAAERGTVMPGSILEEANALAWRALALSQILHERFANVPLAPAAR